MEQSTAFVECDWSFQADEKTASLPPDMKAINVNSSIKIDQKSQKYEKFIQWLLENGAKFDDVQFPSLFLNGQLMGISAKNYIGPQKCFIAIPNTCIISVARVWQSDLNSFLLKHPKIFSKKHPDNEQLVLASFLTQ